ncbi:MAG TPA: hypothetical protein P5560_10360 [Thermotogota bacterium]|nr:hypothetical protein [Thermotogota bacterium]
MRGRETFRRLESFRGLKCPRGRPVRVLEFLRSRCVLRESGFEFLDREESGGILRHVRSDAIGDLPDARDGVFLGERPIDQLLENGVVLLQVFLAFQQPRHQDAILHCHCGGFIDH